MASRFGERNAASEVLPCFDLDKLTRPIAEFEVFKVGFEIVTGREVVVYRVKRNHCVIDTIETFTIDLEDRIPETQPGPWRRSDLVDVLENKPVGCDFSSELLHSREYVLPNIVTRWSLSGKLLYREQTFPEKFTRQLDSSISGPVIEEINFHTLFDQILQTGNDDVLFVVSRDQSHHAKFVFRVRRDDIL